MPRPRKAQSGSSLAQEWRALVKGWMATEAASSMAEDMPTKVCSSSGSGSVSGHGSIKVDGCLGDGLGAVGITYHAKVP